MLSSIAEKIKMSKFKNGTAALFEEIKLLGEHHSQSGVKKAINAELWNACAGPLVSLPQPGSLVYYFPQGHSEQVAVSTKRIANSHIPNYSNLPSQLMCQVHSVMLHADIDTDEVYAQMTLQPVEPGKDVLPAPDLGLKQNKQSAEVFCKILTPSDTSTHGGFSVPRRAAEKLFPPLDFAVQPPTQELVAKDLHDNTWTFRHIFRGQPKRHLLTTGWSAFVNAKRLRAGDRVLFIRDEKSQLLLGIRRANRAETALPSSVLSTDSMHIGILAAAAHAAANHSPFTVFYNPRACTSEFVISLAKYQKAIYGIQVSTGTRFGKMFETEESGKRRCMGTVTGISDIDPLRWPNSKWRNIQVEWDEPGNGEKQNRVSIWEIETPETPFLICPTAVSTLKRPFQSGLLLSGLETEWESSTKRSFSWNGIGDLQCSLIPGLSSEQQVPMLQKPQIAGPDVELLRLQEKLLPSKNNWQHDPNVEQFLQQLQVINSNSLFRTQISPREQDIKGPLQVQANKELQNKNGHQTDWWVNKLEYSLHDLHTENPEIFPPNIPDSENFSVEKLLGGPSNPQNLVNLHKEKVSQSRQIQNQPLDTNNLNALLHYQVQQSPQYEDLEEWILHPSGSQSLASILDLSGTVNSNTVDTVTSNTDQTEYMYGSGHGLRDFPQLSCQKNIYQETSSNSDGLRNLSEDSNGQSEAYSNLNFEISNGSTLVDPSVSSVGFIDFSFENRAGPVGNYSSGQDLQSQVTSISLADSQTLPFEDIPDYSGGTSSSNVDVDENSLLHKSSWKHVSPPLRTYTKVQKLGSVGRSIDITRFKNYNELKSTIACMFGLEGKLDDPSASGWKLVYVDYENDILLVGDDPWEEFVSCVRCIRILSPSEVQQMSQEGMNLPNSSSIPSGKGFLLSEGSHVWDDL